MVKSICSNLNMGVIKRAQKIADEEEGGGGESQKDHIGSRGWVGHDRITM